MSRFNEVAENQRRTVNEEGAVAYIGLDPEQQLYSVTACNLLQDTFYKKTDQTIATILDLIPKCDTQFVANLAVYLRKEMYLRSVPLILLVGLALNGKLTSSMVSRVVSRADEIKELLAAWQSLKGNPDLKKIPNALKKGIAESFSKFNSYQFRKYDKQGKEKITFKDVLCICHPKPRTGEESSVYKQILNDALDPITTWEVDISAVGSDLAAKRAAWENLLDTNSIPYMAALRNIKNMLKAGISEEHVQKLIKLLGNEQHILKSKQFPFRWYSAFARLMEERDPEIQMNMNRFQEVFEKALIISIDNIPGIGDLKKEATLIACDVSGSMNDPLSKNSSIRLIDVGILLGRMLAKKCGKVITGVFGNDWSPAPFGNQIIGGVQLPSVGLSTYGHKVLDWLISGNLHVDNVMFFSDSQVYSDLGLGRYNRFYGARDPQSNRSAFERSWNRYKQLNPTAKIYMFDLSSYGTYPIDLLSRDVYMVSGWSPNIFHVLSGLDSWGALKRHIMGM
jgi:60 kDa SS-A/Ro ribonucleoprotein